ncbi:Striatin-interacting proteins 2 [Orchesella cincta]|uniref:Striatin-interacting proteins 2 n=1 Tax=Orchesella cincta TaxID=48709 RepID=A0A1D2MTS0_ORCCI|nr:Striatin-interacting proteins 2 [Orchesella cincta]
MATVERVWPNERQLEEPENDIPSLVPICASSVESSDLVDAVNENGCLRNDSEELSHSNVDAAVYNECVEPIKETSCNPDSYENKKIPFVYKDWDTLENELADIYGYYERYNFSSNLKAFNSLLKNRSHHVCKWALLEKADKVNFLHDLLDQLEIADTGKQLEALLAMNYIVQGCWGEYAALSDQLHLTEVNVELLLESDAFWRVWTFFKVVFEKFGNDTLPEENDFTIQFLENSLNVLCTVAIIVMVKTQESGSSPGFQIFIDEIIDLNEDELVIITLLKIFNQIKSISPKCFLVKKVLLLIRSILLLTLGGSDELRRLKESCRKAVGLKPTIEDTVQICRNIEPLQDATMWSGMMARQKLLTWSEFADVVMEETTQTPVCKRSLPWTPKSSIKSLRAYRCLSNALPEESNLHSMQSISSLPVPVKQRIQLIIEYLHVPLANHQIEQENVVSKFPNRFENKPFVDKTEQLFEALLPILEDTVRSLVTVLSEATPRKHMKQRLFVYKTVSTYSSSEDSRRQAQIIAKAIAAVLLLLLKHTKINHIYQFECISSEIVAASFIPTALRYLNRDVEKCIRFHESSQDVSSRYKVMNGSLLYCDQTEDYTGRENVEMESSRVSWRNLFTYINLLRVLNKLLKEKSSRVMMLKMFKAPDCLKRCLKIRDSIFQQYVLKLLKMLCKHLGKEWRRSNQHVVSAVYYKVRHRLLDDWMGGGANASVCVKDTKSWPWEYYEVEKQLTHNVLAYLKRHYVPDAGDENTSTEIQVGDLESSEVKLSETFKLGYEEWLEHEVYTKQVDWDALVKPTFIV